MQLPSTRDYLSDVYGCKFVKEAMSSKHFEKIRQFLHFNDNDPDILRHHQHMLLKIRPFIEHLRSKITQVPFEENLSIDEQTCDTKARSFM